ncbi:acyclic terpene utilization AtuA family protein [Nocardia speluncae]|nr:acyclic terpene utilization AtuA family protein [Nocardia speluncae]
MRPIRIANFSGFFGDRSSALAQMLRTAGADVLTGDYLAEVTMSVLAKQRDRNPGAGYAASFLAQLRPVLAEFAAGDGRIVVNAGGLQPQSLAAAVREMAQAGGTPVPVATVVGDDVLDRIAGTDAVPGSDDFCPVTANAYLGGWGIARALADGARIVVCGRVADASLVVGAAAWWHEWDRDAWDPLAGALIAGHLIECGTQVTGGNFSGFAATTLSDLAFPVAEIAADGTVVLAKPEPSGGRVSVDTVTAQLVYEVQGRWYANPDVVADLSTISLEQTADDVVTVSGTVGAPPPPTTKVALTGVGGWENSMLIGVTGMDFEAKRQVLEQGVRAALADIAGISTVRVELLGCEAQAPTSQNEATGFLRVVAQGPDESAVGRAFSSVIVELALASFPGIYLTAPPGRATRLGAYRSVLVDQAVPAHRVIDEDGSIVEIEPPAVTRTYVEEFDPAAEPATDDAGDGNLVEIRLGALVHTRSGDKGGDANVGVWAHDARVWAWLQNWLTVPRLRRLLPEADDLLIDRVELPNLRAINFVIRGLLGGGAISALRLDSQAKGLGEYLRSCRVEAPKALVSELTY